MQVGQCLVDDSRGVWSSEMAVRVGSMLWVQKSSVRVLLEFVFILLAIKPCSLFQCACLYCD